MEQLTKAQRINLFNRRTGTWLLEVGVYNIIVTPLVVAIAATNGAELSMVLSTLVWVPYLLLRDLPAKSSWGKRLVGLRVASSRGGDTKVGAGARMGRNAILIIPLVPLIEYFVAFYNKGMRRLGDLAARTIVVESDSERTTPESTWNGQLILALVVFLAIQGYLVQKLALVYLETMM